MKNLWQRFETRVKDGGNIVGQRLGGPSVRILGNINEEVSWGDEKKSEKS